MDLEEDSYLNPQTRNVLILDDMMSTASKDIRINDFFYGREPSQKPFSHRY